MFKTQIDDAHKKMVALLEQSMSGENLQKNKDLLQSVVDGLKLDYNNHSNLELKFYGYNDAKSFVRKVYSMTGKFADHDSLKHRIAVSLSKLMEG